MSNLPYCVALGVGAAIALSSLKPGASTQDLQSLAQSPGNKNEFRDAQPIIIPTVRTLSPSAVTPHPPTPNNQLQSNIKVDLGKLAPEDKGTKKTGEAIESSPSPIIRVTEPVEGPPSPPIPTSSQTSENQDNSDLAPATDKSVVVAAISPLAVRSQVVDSQTSQNTTFVKNIFAKVDTNFPATADLQERGKIPIATLLNEKASSQREFKDAPTSSVLFPSSTQVQRTPLGSPLPLFLAQSKPAVKPQPPQINPGTPAPEFLNPSANPLLFPTQSDEVQVKRTQPITLQQALELARRNSKDLQTARLNLERAQLGLQTALAQEYPTGNVGLDFARSESNNPRQVTPLNPDGKNVGLSFTASLALSYDLYTGGRRPAQIKAAESQVRFQQLEVERISEQLRLGIAQAYYNLQQADALVDINQAAVTDAARSLRDAQLLEQAGLGTQFDVLQAQVSLANANQDLTKSQNQQSVSRRKMVQLLSLGQQVDVSASDPIEVAGNWDLSLEQSIIMALKNRADLEQPLLQRDINQQQRIIALASQKPQVSLSASYNVNGITNDNFGPGDDFRLGASLRWNFFDGGAAKSRAQQSLTDISIAENNFAAVRNQVRLDVEQAYFDLTSNRQNIERAKFALERSQQSLRLARLRFSAGVGTQADVITQQTELTRSRGNLLNAILDYNRALAAMQRAITNLPDSKLFDLQ